jgi:putative DNA primase/helicase
VTLEQTLAALGMTPPRHIALGRFMRFPGCGKNGRNTAGWCRLIMPTLAVYGDWSTGLSEVWRSDEHVDSAEAQRLLREARDRERRMARERAARQSDVAREASRLIATSKVASHAYLVRKGFPDERGLVCGTQLVIPMRDVADYDRVLSAQLISESGEKLFLTGGRAMGAVYRIGAIGVDARVVLCEGYATGLSLHTAMARLRGKACVVCCFSANNLERVATHFPGAVIAADNDLPNKLTGERAGEAAAIRTGLKWVMPSDPGDFNDLHQSGGIHAVVEKMREVFQ